MELNDFIKAFADEFDETPADQFTATTDFKSLDEWGSLTSLSIIAMVDENLEKRITGADLRECATIEDLYNLALSK
ncbi:MAG: phosphopantetheine-binding protein [Mediterranea sp.]|jgi:acyl carrier protein|nr:phosphopantetheine-binding protein [Mediterranea sp.]